MDRNDRAVFLGTSYDSTPNTKKTRKLVVRHQDCIVRLCVVLKSSDLDRPHVTELWLTTGGPSTSETRSFLHHLIAGRCKFVGELRSPPNSMSLLDLARDNIKAEDVGRLPFVFVRRLLEALLKLTPRVPIRSDSPSTISHLGLSAAHSESTILRATLANVLFTSALLQ